jgi:hypothetical protein
MRIPTGDGLRPPPPFPSPFTAASSSPARTDSERHPWRLSSGGGAGKGTTATTASREVAPPAGRVQVVRHVGARSGELPGGGGQHLGPDPGAARQRAAQLPHAVLARAHRSRARR